jgi:hypothetical protein
VYITAAEAGLIDYKWACNFLTRSAGAAGNQKANATCRGKMRIRSVEVPVSFEGISMDECQR